MSIQSSEDVYRDIQPPHVNLNAGEKAILDNLSSLHASPGQRFEEFNNRFNDKFRELEDYAIKHELYSGFQGYHIRDDPAVELNPTECITTVDFSMKIDELNFQMTQVQAKYRKDQAGKSESQKAKIGLSQN